MKERERWRERETKCRKKELNERKKERKKERKRENTYMAGEQNRKFDGEVIKLFFEEIWKNVETMLF